MEEAIEKFSDNSEYMLKEFKQKTNWIQNYLECKKESSFKICRKKMLSSLHLKQTELKFKLNLSSKEKFFCARYVRHNYSLNDIEWFALIITMMFYADKKYRELILKIESESVLTYNAIFKLYFFVEDISEIKGYYNILSQFVEKMNSLCFINSRPEIDVRLYENIRSNAENDIKIPGLSSRVPTKSEKKPLLIREDIALKLRDFIESSEDFNLHHIFIEGDEGIGKRTIVKRVCALKEKAIVYIDLSRLKKEEFENNILIGCREAFFLKAYICFYSSKSNLDDCEYSSRLNFALDIANRFSSVVFVLLEKSINYNCDVSNLKQINIRLPELSSEESIKLWSNALESLPLDKNLKISEFVNKFSFTPFQIKQTVSKVANYNILEKNSLVDSASISYAARSQASIKLSQKAWLIRKKHTWDELVLSPKEKEIIMRACNQIKLRHIVYDKWKMKDRVLYGKGLSMLFAGSSGTGKTMAAQVVANELDLDIYKVDLSRIISKYIGESEKNLNEVFEEARKSNVILLFDEMDALFSKRTEVKDSHDRNANLETSYLLQKMEEFSGITIMTTNFLENIDKAFFRRINYVVHFAFPDAKARKEIWEKMYPKAMPLAKDVNFEFLSKQFEISGGSIKNVALTSAFMGAAEDGKITMKHIVKALEYEIKKQGKMVSKEDFAYYGYLL